MVKIFDLDWLTFRKVRLIKITRILTQNLELASKESKMLSTDMNCNILVPLIFKGIFCYY